MEKKNKKVVFLISYCPDPRISKRIKSLAKITSSIAVVYWNRFKELQTLPSDVNIKTKELNIPCSKKYLKRLFGDIKLFFASYSTLCKESPDLLYIDGLDMLIVGQIYRLLHKFTKIIYEISDIPGGQFIKNKIIQGLIKLLNKIFLRDINLLVLTSPFYQKEYNQYFHPHQIIILENLPERRLFKNFRSEKHEKLTIGFIGSVRYRQQLINLFEGCKNLDRVQIIIAGEGPDSDYIKEVVKKYSNVVITGPFDYEKEIIYLYNKIDLVYAVYDTSILNVKKAIPNKLYEAIVCALPIIVAKNTGLAEMVNKYKVGFAVSGENSVDVKDLITKILTTPDILEECKENANRIKEKFYFEEVETDFLNKVGNILN